MKIDIDRNHLKDDSENTQKSLLEKIATGKAMLFTGAGFSMGTKNVEGAQPPFAKDLAKAICRLGYFDEDEDLRYAADYFLSRNEKSELISLLKRKYTLNEVSDIHTNICKVNWKRCYTTNYDKSIEIASGKVGKVVECVDLCFPTQEFYKREHLCIHLNGSIELLTEESLEHSFKLSTSSYISADSFVNSDWHYYFKRDLERSTAIVFVGYSLYDIEIQKVLFENEDFKEKTYFITRRDSDSKSKFTLSKFGYILPIEVEGFANLINEQSELLFEREKQEHHVQALSLYELSNEIQQIRDSDIENMFMYGDINKNFIDDAITGEESRPYLILRDKVETVLKFIQNKKNVVICSELGNGKSIFLCELKCYLSLHSIEVYEVTDENGDYIRDIDILAKSNRAITIILDNYEHEHYLDLLTHYCHSLPKNITIVASNRTSEHDRFEPKLKEMKFSFCEINIDSLTDEEVKKFVKIIDNLGRWGDRAGWLQSKKISFLTSDNKRQISSTLLSLLDAPQMKEKISSLLGPLYKNPKYKDTIFAILLLNYLDRRIDFSLVSDVARNDCIYESQLRHDKSFKQLFRLSGNQVIPKSSLFCLSLIKNHFSATSATYITQQFKEIARKFNCKDKDYTQEKIFKSILRFSFVERLLPNANKMSNIKNYYEDLKVLISWLQKDPNYWLQYGMAHIMFKEYDKAQNFFNQAYAIADQNKQNYDTKNIDNQQAHLHLLVAIEQAKNLTSDKDKIYENFDKANKLLAKANNDGYKFKQVAGYLDYFESCYSKLSRKNQTNFEHACKKMFEDVKKAEEDKGEKRAEIAKAEDNLSYILKAIK